MQEEEALGGIGGLHIAVLALYGIDEAKVNEERLVTMLQAQLIFFANDFRSLGEIDDEVGEILAGLDVILIGIGPVELHFLAIVGNGKGRSTAIGLAAEVAAGDEVCLLVVALEEAVEVIVNLPL
ncbi:MAG TPA: hypothetical protein PLB55_01145, partial [Prosthecobacter sp.]|nr:hypothetical protein [Prosthecobacter sp.]